MNKSLKLKFHPPPLNNKFCMENDFNFEKLAILFQTTHEEMQGRAARSVDIALVVRVIPTREWR